jgi:hypothetical protein
VSLPTAACQASTRAELGLGGPRGLGGPGEWWCKEALAVQTRERFYGENVLDAERGPLESCEEIPILALLTVCATRRRLMTNPAHARRLSVEDYLAAEDGAELRHEYIDGELYAMTGASDRHGLITLNLATFLRASGQGLQCNSSRVVIRSGL